jgi:hypothetical protein
MLGHTPGPKDKKTTSYYGVLGLVLLLRYISTVWSMDDGNSKILYIDTFFRGYFRISFVVQTATTYGGVWGGDITGGLVTE